MIINFSIAQNSTEYTTIFPETTSQFNSSSFEEIRKIGQFIGLKPGLNQSGIIIVINKTLVIPNFSFNGNCSDAYFWVGDGTQEPDEHGQPISKVQQEKPSAHDNRITNITLPQNISIDHINYFGVWCNTTKETFGYVIVTKNLSNKSKKDNKDSKNVSINLQAFSFFIIISCLFIINLY